MSGNDYLSFYEIYKKEKALRQNAKGLEMSWLPRQNDFRNFCMLEETDNVCRKLEEVIGVC